MCGIVGVAGDLSYGHGTFLKELFLLDTMRGHDSSGVLFVDNTNRWTVDKQLGGPTNLYGGEVFGPKGLPKSVGRLLLCHNRAATSGNAVIEDNAHPFIVDNIIGVHNGSLSSTYSLEQVKDESGKKLDLIDSEIIFHTIKKRGLKDTWKDVRGSAALVWFDTDDGTLNFIRNSQRPMYLSYKKGVLYWASEKSMLMLSAIRNKVDIGEAEEGFDLEVDTHYTYEVSARDCKLVKKEKIDPPKYIAPPAVQSKFWDYDENSYYQGYHRGGGDGGFKNRAAAARKYVRNSNVFKSEEAETWVSGNYALDTHRCSKESRGLIITATNGSGIKSFGRYALAEMLGGERVEICFVSPKEEKDFWECYKVSDKPAVLRTKARMRFVEDKFWGAVYRIGYRDVDFEDMPSTFVDDWWIKERGLYTAFIKSTESSEVLLLEGEKKKGLDEGVLRTIGVEPVDVKTTGVAPYIDGTWISYETWMKLISGKNSCCPTCDKVFQWEARADVHWIDNTKFVCQECAKDKTAIELVKNEH